MIQISIIGMGLIGTSLGMALRSASKENSVLGNITITGYDHDQRATADARNRLAIDKVAKRLEEATRDAQLIIMAVPPQILHELFTAMAPTLPHGTVVTDVASTKTQIMAWADELLPRTIDFVGGHPMAGKEQSGPAAAETDLFKNTLYCLSPAPRTKQSAIDLVDGMVHHIGAKPYYIDPVEHDSYVAAVSHLPFVLSRALVEVTHRSPSWKEMAPLAATGFRDISRLASGDVAMHRDICITNQEALTRWIDETIMFLQEMREHLSNADHEQITDVFQRTQEAREEWLRSRPNMRPGESEYENITGENVERPGILDRMFGMRGPRDKRP
ncbi:MAG: prephenate dehydrogenase/arogenate dehydrogenase family protein [Chloroflexota bacterium]